MSHAHTAGSDRPGDGIACSHWFAVPVVIGEDQRSRHWSRLEELLEDALIKVTAVASKTGSKSVRDMIEALIAGQRDPQVLAGLARGKMRAKHDRLAGALARARGRDGRRKAFHSHQEAQYRDQVHAQARAMVPVDVGARLVCCASAGARTSSEYPCPYTQ